MLHSVTRLLACSHVIRVALVFPSPLNVYAGCSLCIGLDTKSNQDEGSVPIAIYNGKKFCLRTGHSNFWNALKIFWHYGFSLFRMNSNVNATLKKFQTIYDLQAKRNCYATVPELLKGMGGDEMHQLTKVSARDYMLHQQGWSQKLVDELVTAALYMIYGQNAGVNAFTGLVALAGMQNGDLWSVVGGNKLIPERLLENSRVTLYKEDVVAVTRSVQSDDGKPKYTIATNEGVVPTDFDVVIVANPLNISSVEYKNFTTPVYSAAAKTPFQRTVANFVKGKVNPKFFGLDDYDKNFPMFVLVTELIDSTFAYRYLARNIPSELPASEIKAYLKPIRDSPVQVWTVFSPEPLTEEQKQQLFSEIEGEAAVDWLAYPQYQPPEHFPPFILDDGVFYVNAIEQAASAMEMSAIGARNASLLAAEYLSKN